MRIYNHSPPHTDSDLNQFTFLYQIVTVSRDNSPPSAIICASVPTAKLKKPNSCPDRYNLLQIRVNSLFKKLM
jgi:hypothetical protein